jgi:transposase-like protein
VTRNGCAIARRAKTADKKTNRPTRGKGGRPTAYKPDYVERVRELCNNGATDVEIADAFNVDVTTIFRWKNRHPEFCSALKAGKEVADARVERTLFHRAVGYSYDAETVRITKEGKVIRATYRQHVLPDTTAQIFWLKNRQPAKWRDVQRHEVGAPGEFDQLTNEELLAKAISDARALGASEAEIDAIRRIFEPKQPVMIEGVQLLPDS